MMHLGWAIDRFDGNIDGNAVGRRSPHEVLVGAPASFGAY